MSGGLALLVEPGGCVRARAIRLGPPAHRSDQKGGTS